MATLIVPGDLVDVIVPGHHNGHARIVRLRVREAYPVDGGIEITGTQLDDGQENTLRVPDEFVQVVTR